MKMRRVAHATVAGRARRARVGGLARAFLVCWLVLATWATEARAGAARYVHIRITGVINPIKVRYVEDALERARREHADLLLVSIDTPGGLVSSMERIVGDLTNSPIPVVGFVEPTSAQATSAGAFILLAADVAAMAPHTVVGAAHPVGSEGKDLGGVMNEKATNSLVSLARSLTQRRGRPESFGESIVRQSASYTAEEAKGLGAIEIVAPDAADLMEQLDGRTLEIDRHPVTLRTRGAAAIEMPMTLPERLLDHLADPTIASLLMTLGVLGILYELSAPGIGVGGIVGVISLLTGLAAMSILPLELGGVLLLVVGLVAIGIEIKLQTHGALAIGGVVALVLGGLMLVDKARYFGAAQAVDWRVFAPFVAATTGAVVLLATKAVRSQRARQRTGVESLVGRRGRARSRFEPAENGRFEGTVFVDGARWQGVAREPIAEGEDIEVLGVVSAPMRLEVERAKKGSG